VQAAVLSLIAESKRPGTVCDSRQILQNYNLPLLTDVKIDQYKATEDQLIEINSDK